MGPRGRATAGKAVSAGPAALRESVAMKRDITELEHKIEMAVRDMTIRVGCMLVVLFAAFAGIKFFR
jgi:hypothetical protein